MSHTNLADIHWKSFPIPSGIEPTHFLVGETAVPANTPHTPLTFPTHWGCLVSKPLSRLSMTDSLLPGLGLILPRGGETPEETAFWATKHGG